MISKKNKHTFDILNIQQENKKFIIKTKQQNFDNPKFLS